MTKNFDVAGPQPKDSDGLSTGPFDNWTGGHRKGVTGYSLQFDPLAQLERLRLARENIDGGWTQGAYALDGDGNILAVGEIDPLKVCERCAMGALYEACTILDPSLNQNYTACPYTLKDIIEARAPGIFDNIEVGGLMMWNDAPGRTKAQVVALFDEVIRQIEEEQGLVDTKGGPTYGEF